MNATVWQKLDGAARRAAPATVTLLLVLIGTTPLQAPFYGSIAPMFALMSIYYWAIHRPDLMPLSLVFAIGLVHDVLTGAPLGIHSFVFLVCHWIVYGQRRFLVGRAFGVLWWGFFMMMLMAAALEWAAFSAYFARVMPVEPVLFRTLLTVALFPVLAWGFIQVHRGFLRQYG
jgi:rod shape-determining protein MreD